MESSLASAQHVYVLKRMAPLSQTSKVRVPTRYTVNAPSEKPAHLVVFERRRDAAAYHAAVARFWVAKRRLPMLWTDVKDLLDGFYFGARRAADAGKCPLDIELERLSVDDVATIMQQNSLSCLDVRSITRAGGLYVMEYAFYDACHAVDVRDKMLELECIYFMS